MYIINIALALPYPQISKIFVDMAMRLWYVKYYDSGLVDPEYEVAT